MQTKSTTDLDKLNVAIFFTNIHKKQNENENHTKTKLK